MLVYLFLYVPHGQEIQCFLNKMETTAHLSSPLPFIWLIYKTRLNIQLYSYKVDKGKSDF